MPLLAATPDALYRVTDETTDRVLDAGVRQVGATAERAYAATADALLESGDGGSTWTETDLPAADVHSVASSGDDLLAGVRPLGAYRRRRGEWRELTGLRDLAAREGWPTPAFRDDCWARSVATDGDCVLVGVEVGGLAVRDADGIWRSAGPTEPDPEATSRRDDVHHVAVRGRDDWLLATGDGVFHTTDAGGSWTRLDTGHRRYARELHLDAGATAGGATCGDGRLRVGVNDSPPRWQPPDAALYVGTPGTLERVGYRGEPERLLVSWAVDDGVLYAGANDGTVLRSVDGAWSEYAAVPVGEGARTAYGVRSLAVTRR